MKQLTMEPAHTAAPSNGRISEYVEGFLVPANVRYHSGHAWAQRERKRLMRVGVDEFGSALLGTIDHIETPPPGPKSVDLLTQWRKNEVGFSGRRRNRRSES